MSLMITHICTNKEMLPKYKHTHTHTHTQIYIYIYISSSSSCRTISTDMHDPISPPLPIVHCFRQVFRDTSRIGTELLYVGSSWSHCLCSSMWKDPHPSLLAGLLDYILCPDRFVALVGRPYARVHRSTPIMSLSLLLQKCPTCLVRLILIVFVMGCWWPYSCCFVGYLFNIARSIIV